MGTLEDEFAYATCCNLATLDELISIKATSKHRIERQRKIALKMLIACKEAESVRTLIESDAKTWSPRYNRVGEIFRVAETAPEGIQGALDAFIARLTATYSGLRLPRKTEGATPEGK